MTVMTHVVALEAGQSSQGTAEPITPVGHSIASSTPGRNIMKCDMTIILKS